MAAERLTLGAYTGTWLAAGRWRSTTRAFYQRHLRRILPALGHLRVRDVRRSTVEAFLSDLARTGASRSTVSGVHRTLRALLASAVRDGVLEANPATAMRVPGPGSRAEAAWSAEELVAFLDAAGKSRWYPLLRFLATTGCRISESAGLTWDRMDLEARTATIDRALVWHNGSHVWSEPKTRRGRRRVPLDAETAAVLRAWKADQAAERLAHGAGWGKGWADHDLVFTTPTGAPIDPPGVRKVMRRVARMAGIDPGRPCSPHVLRHTVATLALTSGKPPTLVADALGHDPRVLLGTYAHAVEQAGVADVMAAVIDGGPRAGRDPVVGRVT